MKLDKNFFSENIKTLIYALIIAIIIRSLFVQPFYIPSSSMEPTLLVGDRLFVTKYTYGYSKHSFPFSPPILNKRFKTKNYKCFLSISDEKNYSTAFAIIQTS